MKPCGDCNVRSSTDEISQASMRSFMLQRMNPHRFRILTMWQRSHLTSYVSRDVSYWANEDERLLGLVFFDLVDSDFGYTVLARDRLGRYRAVDVDVSISTRRLAESQLEDRIIGLVGKPDEYFYQDDEDGREIDFFDPVVSPDRLNPLFKILVENENSTPGLGVLRELAHAFTDQDGNFVKDFQTAGFNQRLWELYIYAAVTSMGFSLIKDHAIPDFTLQKLDKVIHIEAVTVNPTQDIMIEQPVINEETSESEIEEITAGWMAIKFGSSLFSKYQKKYWEKEHVKGLPLVLAIADFHQEQSMLWSQNALWMYLYGVRLEEKKVFGGDLERRFVPVERHVWKGKSIPSGFFDLEDSANISGVLFSNAGTLSKFNRMGILGDFGSLRVRIVRGGLLLDPDPESQTPIRYSSDVDNPDYQEDWYDELQLFHNPNARQPIDPEIFSGIAHHFFIDGEIRSIDRPYRWLSSVSMNIVIK